ncbi:cupin domain-containing protein [Natronococcus sp. JC468]|uniref:cupin domain-containing protein n=1 Tax=Natronococcus sp. JC468 TaxID=1961921 RepID=UPI00143BECD4|nr:cupin domain-containing protein [Natronococcus sp. JC468]NKE34737.1 cupin domain-containing protein [Natronococcus sp. JC468]
MTNAINEADLEWTEYDRGSSRFRRKQLSSAAGADDIGCSLYELPPGERSWPYHYHTANEEALFVLDGEGMLRCERGEESIEPGDFVTLPASEDGGHQVVNDSDRDLRYLMVSTMVEPDVTVYPEMDKFGVFVDSPPGGEGERSLHGYYRLEDAVDYWED